MKRVNSYYLKKSYLRISLIALAQLGQDIQQKTKRLPKEPLQVQLRHLLFCCLASRYTNQSQKAGTEEPDCRRKGYYVHACIYIVIDIDRK